MVKRTMSTNFLSRGLSAEARKIVNEYETWWDQWANARDKQDKPSAPVFHYTSWAGFRGIMQSESFWLHSIFCMNDETELDYGLGIAREELARRNFAGHLSGDDLVKAFVGSQLAIDRVQAIRKRFGFYSMSFGERDDDGQWQTYGDERRGVAIGLGPDLFANVDLKSARPEDRTYVAKVLYGSGECRRRQAHALDVALEMLRTAQIRGIIRKSEIGQLLQSISTLMNAALVWNSVTTKDTGWEHERELRMLAVNDLGNPHLPVCARDDGRPYVIIPAPLRKPGIISEIMIGADAPPGAEKEVEESLRALGLIDLPPIIRAIKRDT